MKFFRTVAVVAGVLALAGCASAPVAPLTTQQLWQDESFHYQPGQVVETSQALFQLDKTLAASLKSSARQSRNADRRLELLISQLYGSNGITLGYLIGHTTARAETWRNK